MMPVARMEARLRRENSLPLITPRVAPASALPECRRRVSRVLSSEAGGCRLLAVGCWLPRLRWLPGSQEQRLGMVALLPLYD